MFIIIKNNYSILVNFEQCSINKFKQQDISILDHLKCIEKLNVNKYPHIWRRLIEYFLHIYFLSFVFSKNLPLATFRAMFIYV